MLVIKLSNQEMLPQQHLPHYLHVPVIGLRVLLLVGAILLTQYLHTTMYGNMQ